MNFYILPINSCFLITDVIFVNNVMTNEEITFNNFSQYNELQENGLDYLIFNEFCFQNLQGNKHVNINEACNDFCRTNWQSYCQCDAYNDCHKKVVKRRVRKSPQLEIEEKLLQIQRQILSNRLYFGYFMRKAPEKDRNYTLKRSSKYIGVSMNGNNWQAMINNGYGKKYIGTYASEKEAAVVYDFYSFALHDCNHQTNFDYNVETVEEMIESFFEHEKILIPSLFIDKAFN